MCGVLKDAWVSAISMCGVGHWQQFHDLRRSLCHHACVFVWSAVVCMYAFVLVPVFCCVPWKGTPAHPQSLTGWHTQQCL